MAEGGDSVGGQEEQVGQFELAESASCAEYADSMYKIYYDKDVPRAHDTIPKTPSAHTGTW